LDKELHLGCLYKATRHYYGDEGQESIDPVVFFKICLVGYLNNITSDRRLIEYCSDSLYLKYDIDEQLPRHSTISRTRQLYGEEVFRSLFKEVFFFGQLSVDTSHHVITGSCADFADKRDSQCPEKLCEQTLENLRENEIRMNELLAGTSYSSGVSLQYLEQKGINARIPNFGQFTPEREGFIYNKELNQYECQRGNCAILPFKNVRTDSKGYTRHCYRSSESACKNCEHRIACCGEKTGFKKIEQSQHHDIYMRNHEKRRKNERYASRMFRLRSATVEPVLGTLVNFLSMKRVNARRISQKDFYKLYDEMLLISDLCVLFHKINNQSSLSDEIKKSLKNTIWHYSCKSVICARHKI
jgi:hypothetical protein